MNKPLLTVLAFILVSGGAANYRGQQPAQGQQAAAPALEQWTDDFGGNKLDQTKWEQFTFEGGSGGKIEVSGNQLHLRGIGGSRWGVRTKQEFAGERFLVEATVAKVGAGLPNPGESQPPLGFATLTVLFDGSGRNRIEWLLTSEHTLEAWLVTDGRGERLDNRRLGTKEGKPTLGIARRGNEIFFMLNGEVGLKKEVADLPRAFHVMLYGFGSSENDWASVRVVTTRPPGAGPSTR